MTIVSSLQIVLLIALIVGLIKPSNVLKWDSKPTRLKVFAYWFTAFFILGIMGAAIDDIEDESKEDKVVEIVCNEEVTCKEEVTPKRELPNDDALNNVAYIELVDYYYKDSDDYGKCVDSRILTIKGRTNLPEKSNVKIDTEAYVPSLKQEGVSDTYGNAEVKNGIFEIQLKPWNIPHRIIFRIFKNDQSEELVDMFGEEGCNLNVLEKNKGRFPQWCFYKNIVNINEEIFNKRKQEKLPDYKFQTESECNHEAEKVLAKLYMARKNKDWKTMEKQYMKGQHYQTAESIENELSYIEIVGFEIIEGKLVKDSNYGEVYWMTYKVKHKPRPNLASDGIQTKISKAKAIRSNMRWKIHATGLY